jgi:hypothetical protein
MPENTTAVRDLVDIPLGQLRSTRDPGVVHNALDAAILRVTQDATTNKDRSARFNSSVPF